MSRLTGKVAIVTGGAQGLGAAIVQRFAADGATVYSTDIDQTAGAASAASCGAKFIQHDVSDPASWQAVVEQVENDSGALHAVVNNAGIEGDVNAPKDPENAPLSDWERIFKVNATGVFLGCQQAMPLMAQSGGGSIVNVSSVAALVPTPFITAYGAAKAAVAHLTQSVALYAAQQGYKIRCNSIHPGQVRTPMLDGLFERWSVEQGTTAEEVAENFRQTIPLSEFQEPEDIAAAALFLASDEARFITGQMLAIDGGFTLVN